MKCRIGRKLLVFVCVTLLAVLACGASAESGLSRRGLYDNMVQLFNEGKGSYYEAYEMAVALEGIGGQSYEDASKYISYLKGWMALNPEEGLPDYDMAQAYFEPIQNESFAGADDSFQTPGGLYNYIMGIKLQQIGQYELAITYYDAAANMGVFYGNSNRSECQMELNKAKYAAAMRYIDQGSYDLAAAAFEELAQIAYSDSLFRAQECKYLYAGQLAQQLRYAEAAQVYNQLGTYQDSADLAVKYATLAREDASSHGVVDVSITEVSPGHMRVTWTDKLELGAFELRWYPGNMLSQAVPGSVTATTAELTNLLPGTLYHLEITSPKNDAIMVSETFLTAPLESNTDITVIRRSVMSYTLQDYFAAGKQLRQLEASGKAKALENGVLPLPSRTMAEAGVGYMLVCNIDRPVTDEPQSYDYLCVLRMGEDYVASVSGVIEGVAGYNRFVSLFWELGDMFDEIYTQAGQWPASQAAVDLYVDGQFLTTCTVDLVVS